MLDSSPYLVEAGTRARLSDRDPDDTSGFDRTKPQAGKELKKLRQQLADLQARLWAEHQRGLLVVIQAMDTGGKDGTIRHVFSGVNPQGVRIFAFQAPTAREQARDYLWRVHERVPPKGTITIFNRSHYEEVLVVRVKSLVPESQWSRRYQHIREFERLLADEGTRIVKLYLHISKEEQRHRLQERIDNPEKNWKFRHGDLEDRALWDEFQQAYEVAIAETSTDYAPWYVVPANQKWYRNLVVSSILVKTLREMDPQYPGPEADLEGIVVE
jgi:PPK2 family polyphosphate:nucleotide phosphotransferase